MSEALPMVYLVRHGETEWSRSRRHTGRTDLPLTADGEHAARGLAERLRGPAFAKVFTSPLQRATRTCELAGFGEVAAPDDALLEWDYGTYEGWTTEQIIQDRPGWNLFGDGCPGGESPDNVAARADDLIGRIRTISGTVLLFSSAHLLRMIAARWICMPPIGGRLLVLGTASISTLGYEHDRGEPVIRTWNLQ
jgi:broad specificity phosphatase PhoE